MSSAKLEFELLTYWTAASAVRAARRADNDHHPDGLEDLLAIALHTDWHRLRSAASNTLRMSA